MPPGRLDDEGNYVVEVEERFDRDTETLSLYLDGDLFGIRGLAGATDLGDE